MINKIHTEDCVKTMARMPDGLVHCVVTSPPYWGLRDYSTDPQPWPEVSYVPLPGLPEIHVPAMTCQLGLEETPEAYVGHIVYIFREIKRVLRQDGAVFLNLGDSYAGAGPNRESDKRSNGANTGIKPKPINLKPKDLTGIPWRVAFALQADGWYLRSDIIWAKGVSGQAVKAGWSGNPMPESVTDRPTKAHEYIFLLTKNERYYYDAEAIKEKSINNGATVKLGEKSFAKRQADGANLEPSGNGKADIYNVKSTRNRRTVWTIATKGFTGAHFAVFPDDLVKPCVLAGSPQKVCSKCGKGWERVVEKKRVMRHELPKDDPSYRPGRYTVKSNGMDDYSNGGAQAFSQSKTLGFHPACSCSAPPAKSIVCDPFGGSGTTAEVAHRYGRNWIISEISPEYVRECTGPRLEKTKQQVMFL